MNLTVRRILYLLFFLFFLVFSAIFIFYSIGYRYDFATMSLEKNGAFFIKSFPRGANIWLDDKKTKAKTPNQLINIRPGQHKIVVEKEGYLPWQKTLAVQTGTTAFAEEISLFFSERPKTSLSVGSNNYLNNKAQNRYAYLVNNELWITNTETAKALAVYNFDQPTELIDWSADNKQILVNQGEQLKILNLEQSSLKNLDLNPADKIVWDNNEPSVIWYLNKQTVWRHNLILDSTVEKFNEVDDFDLSGDYIIIQRKNNSNTLVNLYQKNGGDLIKEFNNVIPGKLKLLLADNDYLIFTSGSKLYIKTPNNEQREFSATLVRIYGRYLIISDNHEIWLYDYQDNWKDILDRSSSVVADVLWHPNGSYYLNEINGQTTIYELDGRDYRNHVVLINDPLKKMYLFNHDGSKLFVLTPQENYYLEIQ